MEARKPLGKVRLFARNAKIVQWQTEQLQDQLINDIAQQLKGRYRRDVRNKPMVSFEDWLIGKCNYYATYSESHLSIEDRMYRSCRVVEVAGSITLGGVLGRTTSPEWLLSGLEARLGNIVRVELVLITNGPVRFRRRRVLAFYPK